MPKQMRRRYLALRVVSDHPVNERSIMDTVWNAVLRLFGEYGASQANLSLMEYDSQRKFAVFRCSHVAIEKIRASIASVTEINGEPAVIQVIGVSGTLRALRKKVVT